MQEFKLDKKYIILMKGCLVIFIAFLALGFALPFLPEEEQGSPNGILATTLMGTLVFGGFSILTWITLKKLPFADVAADEDGIWYMHVGKETGLIYWEEIHTVKEKSYMQRLDLLDQNNKELLRVEYQLQGFELLRDILNEKATSTSEGVNQTEFTKKPLYHLFYLVSVIGFSALGIYLGKD